MRSWRNKYLNCHENKICNCSITEYCILVPLLGLTIKNILINFFFFTGGNDNFKKTFVCLWLHWVFVAVLHLSAARGVSTLFCCVGFLSQWLLLWSMGSRPQASVVQQTGLVASWHVEFSWTKDRTYVPCIGRQNSYPLYHHGNLKWCFFKKKKIIKQRCQS